MLLSDTCVPLNKHSNWIRMRNGMQANRRTLWTAIHNVIRRVIKISIAKNPSRNQLEVITATKNWCDHCDLRIILIKRMCIFAHFCSIESTDTQHVSWYGLPIPWLYQLFNTIWIKHIPWTGSIHAPYVWSSNVPATSTSSTTATAIVHRWPHAYGNDAVTW